MQHVVSITLVTLSDFCDSADVWQMFGLVWHHHEILIITHWSLMDSLKPPKMAQDRKKGPFQALL